MVTGRLPKVIIKVGLDASGLNQKQLAGRLGVDPGTVNKWLKGIQVPRPAVRKPLADTLGLDYLELLEAIDTFTAGENRDLRRSNQELRRENEKSRQELKDAAGRIIAAIDKFEDLAARMSEGLNQLQAERAEHT